MTTVAPDTIEGIDLDAQLPCQSIEDGHPCTTPAAYRMRTECVKGDVGNDDTCARHLAEWQRMERLGDLWCNEHDLRAHIVSVRAL